MVTTICEHAGKYASRDGSQLETSTLRSPLGGVTRSCRYGDGQEVSPRGMSLPATTASPRCPGPRVTAGTPTRFGLGPNIVERTCSAVVDTVALRATTRGHPRRTQRVAAWFVKPMYPPTFPAATTERTRVTFSWEAAHGPAVCGLDEPPPKQPAATRTSATRRRAKRAICNR